MSRVTCHVSHVTCHLSPVTCQQIIFLTFKKKFNFFFYVKKKIVKVVELVGGGYDIDGATPSSFKTLIMLWISYFFRDFYYKFENWPSRVKSLSPP